MDVSFRWVVLGRTKAGWVSDTGWRRLKGPYTRSVFKEMMAYMDGEQNLRLEVSTAGWGEADPGQVVEV